jgi:pimeloyl-ACP methyl ester carboxylesterase
VSDTHVTDAQVNDAVEAVVDAPQGRVVAVGHGWTPDSAAVPIVLLHSLGTSSRLWERTIPVLRAAGRSVVTLDFYGHGRSADPNWVPSIVEHGDTVANVLAALHVDRYHLAGTSLGGIVAIELASRPDCRAESIVLNGTPGWHLESQRMARLRGLSLRLGPSGLPTENTTPGGTVRPFDDTERKERSADLVRCGPWFLNTMWAIASYDLAARLSRIEVPSLVLMGDGDFHLATAYVLRERIRRATLAVIDNAGHLTPYDTPEEVGHQLLEFLA